MSAARVIVVDTRNASEYEREQIREIAEWKGRDPSKLAMWMGRVAQPLDLAIRAALSEQAVMNALSEANRFAARTIAADDSAAPETLDDADGRAKAARNWAVGAAAAGGAGAGAVGIAGLVADIPYTVTLAFRAIRRIGAAYGYRDAEEADFATRVLAAACANSRAEKDAALDALRVPEEATETGRAASRAAMAKPGAVYASRGLVASLAKNLAGRKAAQVVPVVGAAVGAAASAAFLDDVCQAARRLYQERFLTDREVLDAPIG